MSAASQAQEAGQPPPTAEQKAQARERYDAGVRKFDVGRFDEAAADFEAAYQLTGAPEILFNMATAYRAAKHYDKALLMYRAYLRRVPDTGQRDTVEKRIAELTPIVKQQEDEQRSARDEAARRERAERAAQEQQQQQQLAQQQQPGVATPPPPPKPLPRWVQPTGIAVAAVGVAGVGVGIALSFLAKSAADTVSSAAAGHMVFDGNLHDTEARGKGYDAGAIGCYVAGGVLAAAGVALIVVARTHRGPVEHVSALPVAGPSGGGFVVEGRF